MLSVKIHQMIVSTWTVRLQEYPWIIRLQEIPYLTGDIIKNGRLHIVFSCPYTLEEFLENTLPTNMNPFIRYILDYSVFNDNSDLNPYLSRRISGEDLSDNYRCCQYRDYSSVDKNNEILYNIIFERKTEKMLIVEEEIKWESCEKRIIEILQKWILGNDIDYISINNRKLTNEDIPILRKSL